MPRFPVAFNRRKSTADNLDNVAVAGPSFRVLDRSEVVSGTKNFDTPGNARLAVKSQSMPNTLSVVDPEDDNIFANLNINRYVPVDQQISQPSQASQTPTPGRRWTEPDPEPYRYANQETSGSGSSNTTKTTSDNSSRHSNVSTAPSSADLNTQQQQQQFQQQFHQQQQQQHQQEDFRLQNKKLYGDVPVPPIPKSNTASSFLKSAGRTFSFGGQKKHIMPDNEAPQTPPKRSDTGSTGRDRSMTASTVTTATPPKLDEEFTLDLGGDFSKMLGGGFDKRASVMTVRDNGADRPALAPRSLTGNRLNQPTPIQVDSAAKIEPSPYSLGSQHSNERLLYSNNSLLGTSPNENAPPPVPRHAFPTDRPQTSSGGTPSVPQRVPPIPSSFTDSSLKRSSALFGRRRSTIDNAAEAEDEDTVLLKESLFTVNRFLSGSNLSSATKTSSSPSSRFGRDAAGVGYSQVPTESTSPTLGAKTVADDDDNMFDTNLVHSSRLAQRFVARKPSPPRNKVMTPAQFERYRKDKEREDGSPATQVPKQDEKDADDEEDNYEDDEDEAEKSRQAAKQRRKQEAHMAVYRQQMMKVTGEAASGTPARSSMHFSMSTPNLPTMGSLASGAQHSGVSPQNGSDAGGEDEDEEVPLAILAAHGFPNKNRPPTHLSTMMSNPNLRQSAAPSYQRPQSVVGGDAPPAAGGRLPVFARNLPQDPYGLVNPSNRETPNFSGGAPAGAPQASGGLPPGGLVGVIASEERSRAMRRGSPNMDAAGKLPPNMAGGQHFDPAAGIPSHMMYPGMNMGIQQPMLTPGDQAQIQMTQQMQQFMQMQMQFMQMMANGGANGMQRPMSNQFGGPGGPMSMGMMGMDGMNGMNGMNGMGGMNNDMARHSFMDSGSVRDMQLPRPDMHMRTMSMVQPSSSASWMQQPQMPGYAPSIRVQGANGYAPSIAPSERSNVGLPGRYRPVSQMPAGPAPSELRKSMTMSGALGSTVGESQTSATTTPRPNTSGSMSPNENNLNARGQSPTGWDRTRKQKTPSPLNKANVADDDDDDEGWAAMKAKRDKKRSLWKSKKTLSSEISALIS